MKNHMKWCLVALNRKPLEGFKVLLGPAGPRFRVSFLSLLTIRKEAAPSGLPRPGLGQLLTEFVAIGPAPVA